MNQKITTGVLLVNLGTPDSPSVSDVRKYLREFLMDGRVIDIPSFLRFLLVNGIIAPFRAPKSAKAYRELWTEEGSPLLIYGKKLTDKVRQDLPGHFQVVLAMRYQNPSIEFALTLLRQKNVQKIIVFPLFPQYASATTGSIFEKVMQIVSKYEVIPEMTFVNHYFHESGFIKSFAEKARAMMQKKSYDHILFSYHGVPERHIRKVDSCNHCLKPNCCTTWSEQNRHCYKAQCEATTRLIAEELQLSHNQYSTVYQSRLGKDPWIQPYADESIKKLAQSGIKSVLVLVPSFVADCLETTIEVGEEYKELFERHGGQVWDMVDSLNADETWVKFIVEKLKSY